MALIRRSRVTTRPEVASSRRARPMAKPDTSDEVKEQLQLIAQIDHQMEMLTVQRAAAVEAAQALFSQGNAEEVTDGLYYVKRVTPMGRSSTEIDPKVFQKKVGDEVFWKCVKVGVTEAKKHLTEAELRKVAVVTEGVPGEPYIEVAKKKGKK